MGNRVKVRYSVEERVFYSGTMEMGKRDFDEMNALDDDELAEAILDRIDRRNPSDWVAGGN